MTTLCVRLKVQTERPLCYGGHTDVVHAFTRPRFNRRGDGIRFAEGLSPVYFEQLTSKRRVVRYVRGTPQARFETIKGKRAETLDATVYAWAARSLIGVSSDRRETDLASPAAPKTVPSVIHSRWMAGH